MIRESNDIFLYEDTMRKESETKGLSVNISGFRAKFIGRTLIIERPNLQIKLSNLEDRFCQLQWHTTFAS